MNIQQEIEDEIAKRIEVVKAEFATQTDAIRKEYHAKRSELTPRLKNIIDQEKKNNETRTLYEKMMQEVASLTTVIEEKSVALEIRGQTIDNRESVVAEKEREVDQRIQRWMTEQDKQRSSLTAEYAQLATDREEVQTISRFNAEHKKLILKADEELQAKQTAFTEEQKTLQTDIVRLKGKKQELKDSISKTEDRLAIREAQLNAREQNLLEKEHQVATLDRAAQVKFQSAFAKEQTLENRAMELRRLKNGLQNGTITLEEISKI